MIVEVEINGIIKRYTFNDYINFFKEDGFFGDYIELYSLNKIIKKPIILLKYNENNLNNKFYELVTIYNNINKDTNESIYNIEDIMFLNYENNIHYEVLIPNLNNIIYDYNINYTNNNLHKSNIDKNLKFEFNKKDNNKSIKNNKELENLRNNLKNLTISDKKLKNISVSNNNDIKNNFDHKKFDNSDEKTSNKIMTNNKKDNMNKYNNNESQINIEFINDKISNHIDIKYSIKNYNYILNNINSYISKFNKITSDDNIYTIPEFPIIVDNNINLYYYLDIYKYLYIKNNDIKNIDRYPNKILNIKDSKIRDDNKLRFRRKVLKYYLDNNNVLYKKILKNKKTEYPMNRIEITEKNLIYVLFKIS